MATTPRFHQNFLSILYVLLSACCGMMVSWILVFPSSWLAGHSEMHDAFIAAMWSKEPPPPTPLSLVMKYKNHSAVQFTHILPAAFWAALIPVQLHPTVRSQHRTLHRYSGYAFVGLSLSIAAGIALIDRRGLYYHLTDFPTVHAHDHTSDLGLNWFPHVPVFRAVASWFFLSICIAVRKAQLRRYQEHQFYILRHVASGMWVSVQRIYVLVVSARTPEGQKAAFGDGAVVGFVITTLAAELAILSLRSIKSEASGGRQTVEEKKGI